MKRLLKLIFINRAKRSDFVIFWVLFISALSFLLCMRLLSTGKSLRAGEQVLFCMALINAVVYLPTLKFSDVFRGTITVLLFMAGAEVGL